MTTVEETRAAALLLIVSLTMAGVAASIPEEPSEDVILSLMHAFYVMGATTAELETARVAYERQALALVRSAMERGST